MAMCLEPRIGSGPGGSAAGAAGTAAPSDSWHSPARAAGLPELWGAPHGRAAHLFDHVVPDVPVRQWVLTLPHRVRYLLAWRHDVCRAVARILHRAIERHLRDVHVHALVLDGAYARPRRGQLRFYAAPVPSATDVAEILAAIVPRIDRLLARHGLQEEGTADPVAEAATLLADWAAGENRSSTATTLPFKKVASGDAAMFKLRFDDAGRSAFRPAQDVIDNTAKAWSVSATDPSGYGPCSQV